MKDRNQKQRRHIRAARQWLGEAEHSLAENHRVRGELKVMLAKVEGTPGHRFVKKWSMRLLPALVALVIAGGGYAFWQSRSAVYTAATAPVQAEVDDVDAVEDAAGPQEAPAAQVTAAVSAAETEPGPSAPAEHLPQAEAAAAPAVAQAAPAQERIPAATEPQPAAQSAPKIPDEGMQKLMQTAGKTLRQ